MIRKIFEPFLVSRIFLCESKLFTEYWIFKGEMYQIEQGLNEI